MEKNIKNELEKIGFTIDSSFITNICERNNEYISNQVLNLYSITEQEGPKNMIIKYNNSKKNEITMFNVIHYISKGSNNKTFKIKDANTDENYVYRMQLKNIKKIEHLKTNFIEYFVHCYLQVFCNENNYQDYILKIRYVGYNDNRNIISSVNDLMNGTLYCILNNNKINHDDKLKILIKLLYKIIKLLIKLQKDLRFMHNDLKSDNIFFKFKDSTIANLYDPDNLIFYLGDFDSSTMYIDNCFVGNNNLSPEDFNIKKDLFVLINSLFFSFNDTEWVDSFFNKFPVIQNMKYNQKIFHSLYSYTENLIDDIYIPERFKIVLDTYY